MAIVSRSSRFPKHWAVDVRGSCVGSYVHFVVKLNIFFAHKGSLRTQERCGYVIVNLRVESSVAWVGCGVAEIS